MWLSRMALLPVIRDPEFLYLVVFKCNQWGSSLGSSVHSKTIPSRFAMSFSWPSSARILYIYWQEAMEEDKKSKVKSSWSQLWKGRSHC